MAAPTVPPRPARARAIMYWLSVVVTASAASADGSPPSANVDPVTRYVHISYPVPPEAPDEVTVSCAWSAVGKDAWQPAKVMPLISETALTLLPGTEWDQWIKWGQITERRAAGLVRTVVFNPYPEAQKAGRLDVDFRIQIQSPDGQALATHRLRVQADNTDVVYIEDWTGVFQRDAVVTDKEVKPADRKWSFQTKLDASAGASFGNRLHGTSPPDVGLPPLSYPLDLRGVYAVFVCGGGIRLRLTGDERTDWLSSPPPPAKRSSGAGPPWPANTSF